MRIHYKGAGPILVITAFLAVFFLALDYFFPVYRFIHYFLYAMGIIFYAMVIAFFRRPRRNVIVSSDHVLSAADGTVVVIEEVDEQEFFHDARLQVSVFMSPLNVHVNWYPVSGSIVHTHYFRGAHLAAYLPKSSVENERMSIVIETSGKSRVMMVQIAGLLARRVFTNARKGNYVFQGEEAGIIKFGSRVDLILPTSAEVLVQLGQKVRACETVIARLR
jgi:phosphatidylserine decarboxylase